MPELNSPIHLRMFRKYQNTAALSQRVRAAWTTLLGTEAMYGLEWGDPETVEPLRFIRDRYVLPYVQPDAAILEIGPGGGRWTRYLVPCRRLYVVDYHAEILAELRRNLSAPNMVFIKNNGTDFPGVPTGSLNFLFSFGVFVHLELDVIKSYHASMRATLREDANVVLQYADKNKIMAQMNAGFSNNDPETMRRLILEQGYRIVEEDLTSLWHSSVVRFTPAA